MYKVTLKDQQNAPSIGFMQLMHMIISSWRKRSEIKEYIQKREKLTVNVEEQVELLTDRALKSVLKLTDSDAERLLRTSDPVVLVDGLDLERANAIQNELSRINATVEISDTNTQQPMMVYQPDAIRSYCPKITEIEAKILCGIDITLFLFVFSVFGKKLDRSDFIIVITAFLILAGVRFYLICKKMGNNDAMTVFIFGTMLLACMRQLTFTNIAGLFAISCGMTWLIAKLTGYPAKWFLDVIGVTTLSLGTYAIFGQATAIVTAFAGIGINLGLWEINTYINLHSKETEQLYSVTMKAAGKTITETAKQLRSVIPLSLSEAERVVMNAPVTLLDGIDIKTADQTRIALEESGAVVTITESLSTQPMMVFTTEPLQLALDTIKSDLVRWRLNKFPI